MEGLPDAVQVGGSEGFGVQHQAWCGRKMLVGIEFVAEDRVADGGKMNAQLVAAAGVRGKDHAAIAIFFGENLIAGVCVFAVCVIDFLPGATFPIGDERVMNVAAGLREDAMDEGDVAFCDAAFGKLLFVVTFGGLVFGDEQETAGRHVETVRGHSFRRDFLAAALSSPRPGTDSNPAGLLMTRMSGSS